MDSIIHKTYFVSTLPYSVKGSFAYRLLKIHYVYLRLIPLPLCGRGQNKISERRRPGPQVGRSYDNLVAERYTPKGNKDWSLLLQAWVRWDLELRLKRILRKRFKRELWTVSSWQKYWKQCLTNPLKRYRCLTWFCHDELSDGEGPLRLLETPFNKVRSTVGTQQSRDLSNMIMCLTQIMSHTPTIVSLFLV